MATQEKTWNVANRLHSQKDSDNPEVNHIIAGADEIYDDTKGAKQSDINDQTDAALAERYTKRETYSKEQLDALITTPDVNHVTVATFADLPQTGEANTIYRVSFYDGTQVDASKYALYAWNSATYQLLAVRSAVGEVFDVSEYNSDATYETLAAALAAVPASVQRGGMSIKFILRTNTGTEEEPVYHDEYVQYLLKNTAWSIIPSDWESTDGNNTIHINDAQQLSDTQKAQALANMGINGIDDDPIADSNNLVRSGGVQKELALGAVYDVSAKNPTAGPNNDGKFESLSALLSDANLNTLIPTSVRKGGMSIKFVQSSDNKYVQYRLMSNSWSITPSDWQGVDDELTADSENLIKSDAIVRNMYNSLGDVFTINSFWGNRITNYNTGQIGKAGTVSDVKLDGICVPVVEGTVYMFSDIQLWTNPNAANKVGFYSKYPTVDNWSSAFLHIVAGVNGEFAVPSGAKYMVLSCETENCGNNKRIKKVKQSTTSVRTVKQTSLSQSEYLTISDTPNTINLYSIGARCEFSTFGSIMLNRAGVAYSAGKIEINGTNIKVYDPTNPAAIKETIAHGLTISDFIDVTITARENPTILGKYTNMATLVIVTTGGTFIRDIDWNGNSGNVRMDAISGNYTNVELSFGGTAFEKDIWIFGDSYLNYWPKYAYSYGMRNVMLDGYSGRPSQNAYYSLFNALKFNKPKTIVWMMGMNNGDGVDAVNSSWKQYYDLVKEYCNLHAIKFIPATIPNTPTINNTFKNAIIKESGYDYLDVANAVGASEAESSWYDGLLSGDNVHPSNRGSDVIAEYICRNLPSIVTSDTNANSVKNLILAESYIVTGSVVRDSDDNISSCAIQYIDGTTGSITLTRNTDGDVTSAVYTYGTDSYILTITRNSNGDVTSTSIIKN